MRILGAGLATEEEVYLGCPVNVSRPSSFQPLIDKVDMRLNSWKGALLSQAGRIALIRSVIESLLVYHLATTQVHKGVLDKIEARIRRFFWGKIEGGYMALVSWKDITLPKELGGLGIRDIWVLNRALLMKNLWKLASSAQPLWAQVLLAKYYPEGTLWDTNRTYACTSLWRGLMQLREDLAPYVRWSIGNGENCLLFAQPWHDNWREIIPSSNELRRLTVSDCMDSHSGGWDESKLINRFGEDIARRVILTIQGPVNDPTLSDKLMYTAATNGVFTLKRAYLTMLDSSKGGISCPPEMKEKWKLIWGLNEIPPKVRVFLWKALKDALPTMAKLHPRIPDIQPVCRVCKLADEITTHPLMLCSTALELRRSGSPQWD